MTTAFSRPLSLALTALCFALPLMTSCGGTGAVQPQTTASASTGTAEANLSGEGQAALRALRASTGMVLTENGYLNQVAVTPVSGSLNERTGAGQLRWLHSWAANRWAQVGPSLVKVQWMRAYAGEGALTPQALAGACQADGIEPMACAQVLRKATHAAVERHAATNTWLVVLAEIDRPLSVQPR
ncbi:hypothetical protein DEDE109153_12815 [Deinococcus deserti]|uniref:Lipoprotein n=1 Tax=Deinococcus deserti (strain DSM 17065 / CIP 109153 / LMG 22923 / VCD115) TaxID=546414 RepID=C1CXS9_DEIDV|nr:hypothetical protein [Deinococcus deserti]ACO44885.1 Hypothetical protein Deide_00850 [Deinococcus deserti VCD115]